MRTLDIYPQDLKPYVVASSGTRSLYIWNTEEKHIVGILKGHDDVVRSVKFSHDGRLIISAAFDHTIRVWDRERLYQIGRIFD